MGSSLKGVTENNNIQVCPLYGSLLRNDRRGAAFTNAGCDVLFYCGDLLQKEKPMCSDPRPKTEDPLIIALLSSYVGQFVRARELARDSRSSARTRYMWFVGICGYVLVNAPNLWKSLAGAELTGWPLFALSIPWVLSALAALIAHLLADKGEDLDNEFFVAKAAALEVAILGLKAGRNDASDVLKAFHDEHPAISKQKSRVDALQRPAIWLERLTIGLLVLSFAWSIVGPLALPCLR